MPDVVVLPRQSDLLAGKDTLFEAALACFRATQSLRPDDEPSRVFIERCTALLRDGPPRDWDGIWHFDWK